MGAKEDVEDAEERPLLRPGSPSAGGAGRLTRAGLAPQLGRALSLRSGTARVVLAAAVSVAWMFVSSLLILLNKYILKDLKFS
ncbi:hypothetical protein MNEG_7751 [Monoraphidium neglectum]|uniref:Uncharacterized protein n=1 Tax=Monoraphidium neglectum TaxID=145388 RepID=A0A0D2MAB5_9CHLO|nr:hypothetical protein MNEG_7751 [Monoraphidium neglectum]KIZ00215.1 hypothetical protein MNEG_7751 [Monoraphidium neglectum]|eukprot:XP_013899234.1 hypothetical protein MNEG_7751 [Monoraphidium neglectum]